MAARGAVAKEMAMNKILQTFPGSFKYDKEIRIPMVENGETIQLKLTLTAAKTNVDNGGDVALPGSVVSSTVVTPAPAASVKTPVEPTAEEKQNVASLLQMLGL